MSINLNTNFKIPANIPIDSRFVFETITDMNNLASNDPKSLYNGLISYVKENSTFYRFYKDETLPSPVGSFTKILDEHGLRFYRNAVNIKTDLNAYNSDSEEGSLVFVKKVPDYFFQFRYENHLFAVCYFADKAQRRINHAPPVIPFRSAQVDY